MLTYFLYGLFVLACFVMILAVLLQPGKADAGALFTSSVSSTAFGPRGTQTLLAKITIGAAAAFMLIALTLSLGVGTRRSVLESTPESPVTLTPQQPAASPTTTTATPASTAAPAANTDTSETPAAPAGNPQASPIP